MPIAYTGSKIKSNIIIVRAILEAISSNRFNILNYLIEEKEIALDKVYNDLDNNYDFGSVQGYYGALEEIIMDQDNIEMLGYLLDRITPMENPILSAVSRCSMKSLKYLIEERGMDLQNAYEDDICEGPLTIAGRFLNIRVCEHTKDNIKDSMEILEYLMFAAANLLPVRTLDSFIPIVNILQKSLTKHFGKELESGNIQAIIFSYLQPCDISIVESYEATDLSGDDQLDL